MLRRHLGTIASLAALALASPTASGEYLLLLDPTRLDAAVASRGTGPDGRLVRPRAVASSCVRDGVFGPAAFAPRLDRCRAIEAVAGLAEAVEQLDVRGAEPGTTVIELVSAGGIVAVEPRRRLACQPGACSRELFDGAGYPPNLVGRPAPPPLPVPTIGHFTVDPEILTAGDSATLSWSAAGVNRCRLRTDQGNAFLDVPPTGTLPVEPARDTAWTLICAAPGGTDAAQAAAAVQPPAGAPEIALFEALRDDVLAGTTASLAWATRRADECALSDGTTTIFVPPNGRRSITVDENTRFVLACANASGGAEADAEVRVTIATEAPNIESFRLDRDAILRGDGVIATWRAPGATQCRLRDPEQAAAWRLEAEGQFRLAPSVTTRYALTCRNARGSDRATATVVVTDSGEPLNVGSFELTGFTPASRGGAGNTLELADPGLVRLDWSTQAATACRIVNDAWQAIEVPPNGSRILRVGRSTGLQLQCVSRDAEAQVLGEVRILGEALFADDFER